MINTGNDCRRVRDSANGCGLEGGVADRDLNAITEMSEILQVMDEVGNAYGVVRDWNEDITGVGDKS